MTNRSIFRKSCGLLVIAAALNACSSIKDSPKYVLSDGRYAFKQPGEQYRKVQVYVIDDSVSIYTGATNESLYVPAVNKDQFFVKRSFDVDVMTVPFKLRPTHAALPRQLTTDFNGNVFVGYRIDRFKLVHRHTPMGWKRYYKHKGISVGAFGGLGSTAVTPWTTGYQINDEYNGLILSKGLAVMFGINNLTVGVGAGWDYLTDRDRVVWIYQEKVWYGLTFGLNLN